MVQEQLTGDADLDRLSADIQAALASVEALLPRLPRAVAHYRQRAGSERTRAESFRLQLGERERLLAAQVSAIAALRAELTAAGEREAETARRMSEMQERAAMNRGPADEAAETRRELAMAGRHTQRF